VEAIAYYRVSTARQGESGYGMEAQQVAVTALLQRLGHTLVGEFTEVESGRKSSRPQLAGALTEARKLGALVVVAKLDRLARDVELISSLVKEAERNGFGGLLFADFPDVDPTTPEGELFIHQMAAFAQFEARRISQRTKAGLAVAKARGVKLGGLRPNTITRNDAARERGQANAERLRPVLTALVAQGASLREMADALAKAGTTTKASKPLSPSSVKLALERLGLR
jgi:DNA invertase Pin-like site-specific DNA recombinase